MLEPYPEILATETELLRTAMIKFESSGKGFVICFDREQRVSGVLTDGDVRRAILEGASLDDKIAKIINKNFISVLDSSPRELILKILDHKTKFVPVIDKNKKLVGVATPDTLTLTEEKELCFRSKAPVRVSFGGGGSDLTHYFFGDGGAVLNAAISLYCHATMVQRPDSKVIFKSEDLNTIIEADTLQHFIADPGPLKLFASVLSLIRPTFGFEIIVRSEFPIGSGLGGSATASIAVLGCFNLTRTDKWDKYEIAEIAYQAERLCLGISGGWQDQYAASFGGFNFIEFTADDNIVNQLRLDKETRSELEANLLLCDLGTTHNSGSIHDSQKKSMKSSLVKDRVRSNVEICLSMKNSLMRGRFNNFGQLLDKAWHLKKSFSRAISNDEIDLIYQGSLDRGALGGKLLGAGGGGFFLFFVEPKHRSDVANFLIDRGCKMAPFKFDSEGLTSWVSKIV